MRLPELVKRCAVIALREKTFSLQYEFPDMALTLFWTGCVLTYNGTCKKQNKSNKTAKASHLRTSRNSRFPGSLNCVPDGLGSQQRCDSSGVYASAASREDF